MPVNEIRDFAFENYRKRTRFSTATIQWNIRKEDLQFFATKLTEKKCLMKVKISKTIKNNYSASKNFWKPKHFLYKISYYRTCKTFNIIQIENISQVGANSSLYSDKEK